MSNKTVILKDLDGNNIYPKIPYTNVFGIPHPINEDTTIFFGNGAPTTDKSSYENIKVDDIYIDRRVTNGIGMYYCTRIPAVSIVNWAASSKYIHDSIDPPEDFGDWSYNMEFSIGIFYINTTTSTAFVLTNIDYEEGILTWTSIGGSGGLPPSISSDAGKVLMVDKNGDPNWFRKDWEIIGIASKGTEGTSTLLDFNDIQIPTNHDYKAFRITYYVNASSSGTVEIKLNGQSNSSFWFGGNSTVSGKKFTEIIIEDHNLPNIDGTNSNYYATATINRCNTYNYGQRTNFLATSQNNIARPQNITSIRLDIGSSWTFDHDSARVILEGKR